MVPQVIAAGGAVAPHHIGRQAQLAPFLPGQHHRYRNPGVLAQYGGHLTRFHTEAADLQLIVQAAQELQLTIGQEAGTISRAVQARTRLAEGIRHEALGGQAAAAQVASGQTFTTHEELTPHTHGARSEGVIQDVELAAPPARADGKIGLPGRAAQGVVG